MKCIASSDSTLYIEKKKPMFNLIHNRQEDYDGVKLLLDIVYNVNMLGFFAR